MMDTILSFINVAIREYGLIVIFIFMLSNGFLSFPPSEVVLSVAGILAATTKHTILNTLLVAIVGNLIGTYVLFYIGVTIGYAWLLNLRGMLIARNNFISYFSKLIPEEKVLLILATSFKKDGAHWIAIFRCLPIIRSIVSLPAGMIKMSHIIFIAYSLTGITIWAMFWQGIGFFVGTNVQKFTFSITVGLFILLTFVLYIFKIQVRKFLSNNKKWGRS